MTKAQAYQSMFKFLDERYSRLPSDSLGNLLGEMTLMEDGRPRDQAIVADWNRAVDDVLRD